MDDPEDRTVVWRRPAANGATHDPVNDTDRFAAPVNPRGPVVNVNQQPAIGSAPYVAPAAVGPTPLQLAVWRAQRVIYYIFGLIEAIIAIRFVLKLIGANPASAFTQGVYGVSWVFVFPFNNVVSNLNLGGNAVIEWFSIVAIIVYMLGSWALAKLISLLI